MKYQDDIDLWVKEYDGAVYSDMNKGLVKLMANMLIL